jgi:ubiquinone/menaquinone biosynthesis C-methylase UbiE
MLRLDVDVIADALHVPFKDASFDYVYSRRCI